jgi:hypothetical protein
MTTASTSSVLSQAAAGSPVGIDAWTGEVIGELLACGLTQTNDTGQLVLTGSGGTATTNATQPVSTGPQSLYAMFTFNDALAGGNLASTALNSGGSGYTGGPYTLKTATGATSGATATVSVSQSGGVCSNLSSIVMVSGSFLVGEKITVAGLAGGTGANWTAASLSSGSPVIFRLDFGGGSAVTDPEMWITLGQGTNGAGTIAGSAGSARMTIVPCGSGQAPLSTSTAYPSYYCYNSTLGTCLVAMKFGSMVATAFGMGFYIHRSNNSAGAPTGTSVTLYSSAAGATSYGPAAYNCGVQQTLNYANNLVYPTISAAASTQWPAIPHNDNLASGIYGLSSTLEASTVFIFPVYYLNPAIGFSAFMGLALTTDIANGTTVTTVLVGSQSVTLISLECLFGAANSPFGVAGISVMAVYS